MLHRNLLRHNAQVLAVSPPSIASLRSIYKRRQTLSKHQLWAKTYLGLRELEVDDEVAFTAAPLAQMAASHRPSSLLAGRVAKATNAALDQFELDPGIGSTTLGKLVGIPELRTWRVAKFPLLWCYFERGDHLDVVRLLGERQDLAAILGDELASN